MKPFPDALWKTCALASLGLLLAAAAPALAQTRVDNPFTGARMYVNPDYTANAEREAAAQSGTLASNMRTVGQQPTAVWMDRIAAVPSLATHLDRALAQGANLFLGVVYDLPGRDCAALASNGELPGTAEGLARYRTEYIDPIAATVRQSKYANLRIVFVVEPDSLPNLVTNLSDPECAQMNSQNIYVQGVQYAVNTLRTIPNVYLYVDAAHSGWLGWPNNSSGFVNLMNTVANGFTGGKSAIEGFVNDTANTLPLREPFMTATQTVGGQQVMSARFYEFNPDIDETSYVADMWSRFNQAGWPTTMAFITDTSRNGWGGPQRPTAASTSTDLNTFVNASKVDRRAHRGLWCNPSGAGIGERPRASPGIAHVDAFVWVKPPGESDGASSDIPNDEGKRFDRMCDPTYNTQYGVLTGALPNAPLSGKWFSAQFIQLVQNAYPPLSGGTTPTGNTLTVTKAGTGSGTVTSNPAGISCGATCSASFSSTTTVTLTAAAASGSTFGGWSGCTGTGTTCTVSMSAARSVTATFNGGGTTSYTLTVTRAGTGSGTVTSNTGGINCGSVCSASYASGTVVTLTRTVASGSTFGGWSGACTGTGTTCTVTMSQARTVTATFNGGGTATYALTVTKGGTGSGTVTSNTGGINCGSVCSASYTSGTTVTLTASAASGSMFGGWSGCSSSSGSTCTVAMTQARTVTATFNGGSTGGTPCANPITFTGNTNNFNTTGAVCYRTSATVNGWGCYNMDGRTIRLNTSTATIACGAGPLPLAKHSDGYTYFSVSAGTYAWAGIYAW
ncbi:MAG TPA: glycoside hydrolase family 6 protein [Anaeromyxobacter sp.]|nr:glycoside hydrolase family 6 protein [Anaeromyxobacter sp.]